MLLHRLADAVELSRLLDKGFRGFLPAKPRIIPGSGGLASKMTLLDRGSIFFCQ